MSLKIFLVFLCFRIVSANLSRIYSNITCDNHNNCRDVMGNRTNCVYGMCQCVPRYHMSDSKICIEDRGLHEACDATDQCYWGPEMIDKIECKGGECSCKTLYIEASGKICIRYFITSQGNKIDNTKPLVLIFTGICLFFLN